MATGACKTQCKTSPFAERPGHGGPCTTRPRLRTLSSPPGHDMNICSRRRPSSSRVSILVQNAATSLHDCVLATKRMLRCTNTPTAAHESALAETNARTMQRASLLAPAAPAYGAMCRTQCACLFDHPLTRLHLGFFAKSEPGNPSSYHRPSSGWKRRLVGAHR